MAFVISFKIFNLESVFLSTIFSLPGRLEVNVLVIGGSGLFGRKTAAGLLDDPEVHSVISMDLTPSRDWFMRSIRQHTSRFKFAAGDVSNLEDILNVIQLYQVDRLINWALGLFTQILIKAPSSPHPVYNVGGPATSLRDMAEVLRKLVPGAEISFGDRSMQFPGRGGLPWKVSMARAKTDFNFGCRPLEESLKSHISDARKETGML
jgi:nucleoside-diphosphate-sugar epimerase